MSEDEPRRPARRLSRAEADLWAKATADIRPARARPKKPPTPSAPSSQPAKALAEAAAKTLAAPVAARAPAAKQAPPVLEIDRRTRAKLKRGRLDVEAKLDLHGMRQAEAQRALNAFLRRAQADGARIAIVVTGKGLTRDEGGVLRRVVPLWLEAPGLRDVVSGFGAAARHHGGEGALYVRIRRAR